MSLAREWLRRRQPAAPASLDAAMMVWVNRSGGERAPEALADGGVAALRRVAGRPSRRSEALDLLAADALLTHACEAAAEAGEAELARILDRLSVARIAAVLEPGRVG